MRDHSICNCGRSRVLRVRGWEDTQYTDVSCIHIVYWFFSKEQIVVYFSFRAVGFRPVAGAFARLSGL